MLSVIPAIPLALWMAAAPSTASSGSAGRTEIDFTEQSIEGGVVRPQVEHILEKPKAKFACDITQLTLAEYNTCFEQYMADLCGMQMIERDRFELTPIGTSFAVGGHTRTIGGSFPVALYWDDGAVFTQETSAYVGWHEPKIAVKNQTPKISSIDQVVATENSFLLADRTTRRVFVFAKRAPDEGARTFRRVDLPENKHRLLGVLTNEKMIVTTSRDVILMSVYGKDGIRLQVPLASYDVDSNVDRFGTMLLVSKAGEGQVFLVNAQGEVEGLFAREPGYVYHLLPSGLVASAHLAEGKIKIRSRTGVIVSRTQLKYPLQQFGVFRNNPGQGAADLYFVAEEGLGVLYGDGFEKSFLSAPGKGLRVVSSNQGVLVVVTSTPSRVEANAWRERTVQFFKLNTAKSRIAKVVEGICPRAIKAAEHALELGPSLRASMKEGRFQLHP